MKKEPLQFSYAMMQAALWGAYGFLFSYANRYLLDRGLTDFQVGLVLGIATAGAFLLQPVLTQIVDKTRLSCKSVLMGSSFLMGLCALALLPHGGLATTVLLYGVACVSLQILPSFSNALGMAAIQQGRRLNFGLARGIGSVSFGICAQLGNVLISRFGFGSIPLTTVLLSALLVLSALPFSHGKAAAKEEQPTRLVEFFRRNGSFALFLLGATLLFIGHNVLTNCMYQIAVFKGDGNAQGTALLISAFVELPAMFLFTKLLRFMKCGKWVCLSGVFFTLRLVLSWLLPGVGGLYAAQLTQMLGFALYTVSSVYYASLIIDKADVVKGQTYLGITNTLGCLFAHLLGGALIENLGVSRMFLVCSLLSAIGSALFFVAVKKDA